MVCKLYICDIGAIRTKVNDHCLDITAEWRVVPHCLTQHLTTGESEEKITVKKHNFGKIKRPISKTVNACMENATFVAEKSVQSK